MKFNPHYATNITRCIFVAAMLGLSSLTAFAQVYPVFGNDLTTRYDSRKFTINDISPDLPTCKRNDALWWKQVKEGKGPLSADWPLELRKSGTTLAGSKTPVFGAEQGLTWIDIDGDGWCDAVVSVEPEAAKRRGLPIILTYASRLMFFDPATKSFHGGQRGFYSASSRSGEITSAFTFYFNKVVRRVEVVERIFSSGMFYSSKGWVELHGRLMFKGAHETKPVCNDDKRAYYEPCAAYTAMNEEAGRVIDDLWTLGLDGDAIKKRLIAYRNELDEGAQRQK